MEGDIMTLTERLTELRHELAKLYPRRVDARRIADEAGLDVGSLQFYDDAYYTWRGILDAVNRNKILAIVEVARRDHPDNQLLKEIVQDL
jgi:hypothetical protein